MARQRNGQGVIEYVHPDGDVTFRIQFRDASGRQVKETLGRRSAGWTRTKAKDERRKRVGKVADGYVRPEAIPFSTYADTWWERRQTFRDYADSTTKAYRKEVSRLKERYGSLLLRDLTTIMVNNWTTERLSKGESPELVNRTLTILGMILNGAVDDKLIDPEKRPRPMRPEIPDSDPNPPTPEQARLLAAELGKHHDPQLRLAFLTFLLLGIRMGELQALHWHNLSFEESRLRIATSKTKKGERTLHVPPVLLSELQAHYNRSVYNHPENFIFCNPTRGTKWRPDREGGYYECFHRACRKLGLPRMRPAHEMRAAWITEALKSGVSPAIVMTMVGHEDYGTTKRYADLVGVTFEQEAEKVADLWMGTLRVIDGGKAEGSFVQEAHN
jgi:integrase